MRRFRYVLCAVALLAVGIAIGFAVGISWEKLDLENQVLKEPVGSTTFYAKILEMNDDYLLVEGLSINDINHRGQYHFAINKDTKLEWNYTTITKSDLKVGATISITYTGVVKETHPAGIDVLKIQLLDETKA